MVTGMAANDTRIVAALADDVYNYVDGQWVNVGSVKEFGGFSFSGQPMLMLKSTVIARTAQELVRSTDYGRSWSRIDFDGTVFTDDRSFHGVKDLDLYRSEDGISWSRSGTIPENTGTPVIFQDRMFTSGIYGTGTFTSRDGGITWEELNATFPLTGREGTAGMGVLFASGSEHLYAIVGGGEIFRSDDGMNWSNITYDLPNWLGANYIASGGGNVAINTAHGLFRLAGTSWQRIDLPLVRHVALTSSDLVIEGTGGIYRLSSGSSSLVSLNQGLVRGGAFSLGAIGGTVIANTIDGIYRTTDRGEAWMRVADFGVWGSIGFVNHRGTLYAVNGIAYRSSDSGATWQMTGPKYSFDIEGPDYFSDGTSIASDGQSVYLGIASYLTDKGANGGWADGGIWRSDDNGTTWKESSDGLPRGAGNVPAPVGSVIATNDYVLISTAAGIYRSTSHGGYWSPAMIGLPTDDRYLGHGELYAAGDMIWLRLGSAIYRSDDGGLSWSPLSPALPAGYSWTTPFAVDDRVYMQTYRSVNDTTFEYHLLRFAGRSWEDVTGTQPAGVIFESMVRAGGYIYAGTRDHGVWRIQSERIEQPLSVAPGARGTLDASLSTFPNPTTGMAEIRFTLQKPSHVRLSLVNPLGEEVKLIDDGSLEAGAHARQFDAAGMPAGTYLLRLKTDSGVEYGRIVKME
jgi:photosystem II stability/assembly factor-like uncharacterized protein